MDSDGGGDSRSAALAVAVGPCQGSKWCGRGHVNPWDNRMVDNMKITAYKTPTLPNTNLAVASALRPLQPL